MSDETRTVRVESLAAALMAGLTPGRRGDKEYEQLHRQRAAAIFAALPVATAGPEPRKALTFEAMKQVMGATAGYQHTLLPCPHCGKAIELPLMDSPNG